MKKYIRKAFAIAPKFGIWSPELSVGMRNSGSRSILMSATIA